MEEKENDLPRGYGGRQSMKLPIENLDEQDNVDDVPEPVCTICIAFVKFFLKNMTQK